MVRGLRRARDASACAPAARSESDEEAWLRLDAAVDAGVVENLPSARQMVSWGEGGMDLGASNLRREARKWAWRGCANQLAAIKVPPLLAEVEERGKLVLSHTYLCGARTDRRGRAKSTRQKAGAAGRRHGQAMRESRPRLCYGSCMRSCPDRC